MYERKQNFTDHSSVMILISLVVMSLIANTFFKGQMTGDSPLAEIRFPAYETESARANSAMPFVLNITLPDRWEVKTEGNVDSYPDVKLYSPYYIYSGEEQVGFIAFNVFTPPEDTTDVMGYHQSVWPVMDRGTMEISAYTVVRLTEKFEAGYCKLSDGQNTADAILCYNKDLSNMVAVVLAEGAIDETALQQICLSLSFSAQ